MRPFPQRERALTPPLVATLHDVVAPALGVGVFVTVWVLESLWPLRGRVSARGPRLLVNAIVATPGFVALRFGYLPVVWWLASTNQRWRVGILQHVPLPAWFAAVLGLLLLDYVAYVWHRLAHRIPLLWRFHVVHHLDCDLDVSTSVRFHFGEVLFSTVIRGAGVLLIGVSPLTASVFEIAFATAATFHHGNVRLPAWLERGLALLFITPPTHGIHHSVVVHEQNSNWGTIFSCWDRLHGTLRRTAFPHAVRVGVAGWAPPRGMSAWRLLVLPFRRGAQRATTR